MLAARLGYKPPRLVSLFRLLTVQRSYSASHPEFEIISPESQVVTPPNKNKNSKTNNNNNNKNTKTNTINDKKPATKKSAVSEQDAAILAQYPGWDILKPAQPPTKKYPPKPSSQPPKNKSAPKKSASPKAPSKVVQSSTSKPQSKQTSSQTANNNNNNKKQPPKASQSPTKPLATNTSPKTQPKQQQQQQQQQQPPPKPQLKPQQQQPPKLQQQQQQKQINQTKGKPHQPNQSSTGNISARQQPKPPRSPFPTSVASKSQKRSSPSQLPSSTKYQKPQQRPPVNQELVQETGVEVEAAAVEIETETVEIETESVEIEAESVDIETEAVELQAEGVETEDGGESVEVEKATPKKTKSESEKNKAKKKKPKKQDKATKKAKAVEADEKDDEMMQRPRRSKKGNEVVDQELDPSLLTAEQENVIKLIVDEGKSLFFTGSAGTGKSFVLKHLVSRLRKKFPKGVYMTAATGIAAVNIGGVTLHSFAGIRLGQGTVESLAERVQKSRKFSRRWKQCKVLVIDEISMIDHHLFDKLDKIARILRGVDKPFGGIQLVLSGDFFQLPPVKGGYIFEGDAWRECIDMCVELTTVMRQKDLKFISILNELRRGMMSDNSMLELRKCCRPLDLGDGIIPTKLYSTNRAVDEENQAALKALSGESVFFIAHDKGPEAVLAHLKKDCPAGFEMELKVGAQVVLLRKVESLDGLVNGSRGVVIGFVNSNGKKGKFGAWYTQNAKLPVIRFTNGTEAVVPPIEWDVWQEERAVRHQLPLKLAWALTIHRAQGMTLDKVECKLSEAFAPGQAYVALSRVRQLDGLYLRDFDRRAIRVSHSVLLFYKRMVKDKNFQSGAPGAPGASSASTPISKAFIRSGNTGSIKGFSLEKGMLVRPVGQRIVHPSASLAIGPGLKFATQTTTTTSSSMVNSLQAISGGYLNKTVQNQVAINTISHIQAKGLASPPRYTQPIDHSHTYSYSENYAPAVDDSQSASEAYETDPEAYETAEASETASEEAYETDSEDPYEATEESSEYGEAAETSEDALEVDESAPQAYEAASETSEYADEGALEVDESATETYESASESGEVAEDAYEEDGNATYEAAYTQESSEASYTYDPESVAEVYEPQQNAEAYEATETPYETTDTYETTDSYEASYTPNSTNTTTAHTDSEYHSSTIPTNQFVNGYSYAPNGYAYHAQNGAHNNTIQHSENQQHVQNGNTLAQNGNKWNQNGNKWIQNGNKWAQNGDQPQNGNKWAQNGNKWAQNGNKWAQNGNKWAQNGDQPQNGNKWAQNGNKWGQNGFKGKGKGFFKQTRSSDEDGGDHNNTVHSDEGSLFDFFTSLSKKQKA